MKSKAWSLKICLKWGWGVGGALITHKDDKTLPKFSLLKKLLLFIMNNLHYIFGV